MHAFIRLYVLLQVRSSLSSQEAVLQLVYIDGLDPQAGDTGAFIFLEPALGVGRFLVRIERPLRLRLPSLGLIFALQGGLILSLYFTVGASEL